MHWKHDLSTSVVMLNTEVLLVYLTSRRGNLNLTLCSSLAMQIDILEVDGKYYGFSGCHRYEVDQHPPMNSCMLLVHIAYVFVVLAGAVTVLQAFQRLGLENIPCKVRKANQSSLRMHMM